MYMGGLYVYLTVITTVLVLTQIIRITQNAINLYRQNKEIKKVCGWIRDNDVSEKDFDIQREVYYMMYAKLKTEFMNDNCGWAKEYADTLKERLNVDSLKK